MPDTGFDRHDGTSSEEESDGEVVITSRRKSFGIRVAQTPQQAQQQVLSQIGNLAGQRQANEVVVQQTETHEKTDAEKKALEQHQKMLEAQQLAKAQQAAALQAAAQRVAQAQSQAQGSAQAQQAQAQAEAQQKAQAALQAAQEQARKAQQEALARAQQAQQEAVARAKQAQEAQLKAQQEALARAQEAQKKAQEEAKKKAEQAQAQAKAQAEAQRKAVEEAQKKAAAQQAQQKQAAAQQVQQKQAPAPAQQAPQKTVQNGSAQVQKQAQTAPSKTAPAQQPQQKQAPAPAQQAPPQKTTLNGSAQVQKQVQVIPQKSELTGAPQKGALAQSQPGQQQQEIHSAAGPKWSRAPGKVQQSGPQPEQPKIAAAVAPPQGKTALRQTAQIQEQDLANEKTHVSSPLVSRKPQIQADHLAQKFVEKPEEQREKLAVQKGQLEGARRWLADSEIREAGVNQSDMERGPKAVILQDDACWQTQRRVPVEIQQPQIGKIAIPELSEKEVQRTIVAQPASYHKVQWNEFPEELKVELAAAPKTKTQDWVPVNNEQNELQRSIYKPARMSAVWPPPQDELIKEGHSPLVVKANDDTAWIQQDQNGIQKQAVWGKTSRINRVWPPPENEAMLSDFGPQHMPVVQWPPPESEAHEREQVEVLQKHIPAKKMERQWPPPPPQYQVVESTGEIETRYNPAEVIEQQQPGGQHQQQVIRTVIRSQ